MTWDNATPIEDPRVALLRSAAIYASELHFDRKANYLVKGWLGSEAVSVVYGDSNCGKSFFGLDISAHVASGQPWMGHNVKKRTCALSGLRRRREELWTTHRGNSKCQKRSVRPRDGRPLSATANASRFTQ